MRKIPILLIKDRRAIKTFKYKDPMYLGDPVNIVRILNSFDIDELIICDLSCEAPDLELLNDVFSEAFFPIGYIGNVRKLDVIKKIFSMGAEKVGVKIKTKIDEDLLTQIASMYGKQAVFGTLDVNLTKLKYYVEDGKSYGIFKKKVDPKDLLIKHTRFFGEIVVNFINREGSRDGYDRNFFSELSAHLGDKPVIFNGGLRGEEDFVWAQKQNIDCAGSAYFFLESQFNSVLISYGVDA